MEPKKKVLIADSDESIIQALKTFVQENFPALGIFVANDGVQAMQNLEKIEFEMLFLDLEITKFDGRKILKEINFLAKNNRPHHIFILAGNVAGEVKLTTDKRSLTPAGRPIDYDKLKINLAMILNPPKINHTRPALEVKFMNPFIDATLNVLKVTTGTEAIKEEINLSTGEAFKGDISAFYPIHSPVFEGFFCLSFPKQTYLKIMSKMLFTEYDEINEENRDGVGELCNQIFGNAKAFFNDKFKTQIRMSTPSITVGDNHTIVSVLKAPRIIVKFSTDAGHFFVEVSMVKVGPHE